MEFEVRMKSSKEMTVGLNLDLVLEEFTPQLCEALARRKRVLMEIKGHVQKDEKFAEKVIQIIRNNEFAALALKKNLGISAEAVDALLNSSLSNPIWNYERRLAELEDSLKTLNA